MIHQLPLVVFSLKLAEYPLKGGLTALHPDDTKLQDSP